MEIGRTFTSYDKVKRGKKQGGIVYISCAANGEIGFHEGWPDEKEAGRRDRAAAEAQAKEDVKGEDGKQDVPAKPELTQAAIRYVDLHRQNAVRVELLKAPQIALRLMAASVIGNESLWDVRPEAQSANRNEAAAVSLTGSKATAAFASEEKAVRELLGLPEGTHLLPGADRRAPDTCTVFARLLDLPDNDVLRVLTFLMAQTLPAGSDQVEALGYLLQLDMDQWWTPDEAFLDLLRDKPAINAMLAEIAGKQTASIHVAATAKVQKDAIRHCLAGTGGRKKVGGWKPRYMRFPMQPYTKRRGLPAVEQWRAIKKHFEQILTETRAGRRGTRCPVFHSV